MKPFDPKGEYTPEEVKAALAGVSGTRQLSYRYERLDKDNRYIEDIDFVQSCTIENNALADIKRTAKMDILDTGSINYLQDRIKPYVRLAMPKKETYGDFVESKNPAVWWKMDDPAKTLPVYNYNPIADDLAHTTRATAYNVLETAHTYTEFDIVSGNAAIRSEMWVVTQITNSDALTISFHTEGGAGTINYEFYHALSLTGELTLLDSFSVEGYLSRIKRIGLPKIGYYFTRATTSSTVTGLTGAVKQFRPARLEDSSGNKIYANVSSDGALKGTAIIGDGGYSLAGTDNGMYDSATSWSSVDGVSDLDIRLQTGFTFNYWESVSDTSADNESDVTLSTDAGSIYLYKRCPATQVDWQIVVNQQTTTGTAAYNNIISTPRAEYKAGPRMVTVTGNLSGFSLYHDGVLIGKYPTSTVASQMATLFSSKITYLSGRWVSNAVNGRVDDFSLYGRALTAGEISELYSKAFESGGGRSGYVEWPQGVFVLSSPTRKMINGNTVVRSVEGYDQLVTLKEDSFDYRYSADQGKTYTDIVKAVLQSSAVMDTYPLTDPMWSYTSGKVTVVSDSSAKIQANAGELYTENIYSISNLQISAKVALASTASNRYFEMSLYPAGVPEFSWTIYGTSLYVEADSKTILMIPYVEADHRHLRIREAGGIIYYEASSDGITWVMVMSTRHTVEPSIGVQAWLSSYNGLSTELVSVDNFSLRATQIVSAQVEKSTRTLPTAMEWETGTSKLDIINDLLGAINYTSATYDENGTFVSKAYISPQNRASQFRYATDAESVLTGDVDQTVDMFGVPNKWVLVVSDPERPALVGTYTNSDPYSPTSTVARGRTIVDRRDEQSAPDQVTLDAQAARLAFEASQVYEVIEFNTALMPIHQDSDIYELVIDGLAVNNKYAEHSWSMTLANGSPMRHRARRVVSV